MSRAVTPLTLVRAEQSIDGLFRAHAGYVAGVAFRLLGRDSEVDDVVQDVFIAALRGLGQLRDPEAVRGWLARVTVRQAMRRLRRRRLRAFIGLDEISEYELTPTVNSQEERSLLARVYTVLDETRPRDRVAWTLRVIEGEPLEEVARLCGCSLATAKRRIAAVQATLEQEIPRE